MNSSTRMILVVASTALLGACGGSSDPTEITETAQRSEYRAEERANATSEQRFPTLSNEEEEESPFHYTVPAGWTEVSPTLARNPNFSIGTDGDMECYVSLLPGDGGGIFANANRWRGQFNAAPYSEEEVENLPDVVIMGHPAKVVNFVGDFKGMGATEVKSDYRIIGALIQTPDSLITIKMIGPDSKLLPELNQFASFVDSLYLNDGHSHDAQPSAAPPLAAGATMPADHPAVGSAPASTEPAPNGAGDYTWEVPEGWRKSNTGSSMRLITFTMGDRPGQEAECAVFVFGGDGGGRLNNFNRWLGQFGQEPLQDTELMLQPTVFFFNEEVPLLVCEGSYEGMGGPAKEDQMLLGASYELETESLYIKFTGPRETVRNNWNKFMVFCASIQEKS